MSFSTIFSIFIIIFIISVAFFAIDHFVDLWKCSSIGLYYDDLKEEVRDAWASTSGWYQDEFTSKIPKGGLFGTDIDFVCFGNLSDATVTTGAGTDWSHIKNNLTFTYRYNPHGSQNVFMYPPDEACSSDLGAITLKCDSVDCVTTDVTLGSGVTESRFFCVPVQEDGTISVWLLKKPTDSKVTIREDIR